MEVSQAEVIVSLCERFHCLPSQLMDEPVDIIQLCALAALGNSEGSD